MNSPTIEPSLAPLITPDFGSTPNEAAGGNTKIGLCLRRGAPAGFRIIVLAPEAADDTTALPFHGLKRDFNSEIAAYWATARRVFLRSTNTRYDRQSWHVLVVDRDGIVVGTVSARLFPEQLPLTELRIIALADAAGPIFREQCELAIQESCADVRNAGRMVGEISDWAVASSPHRRLVTAMLIRATAGLAAAFGNPLWIVAANQFHRHTAPLMRRGAAPLGRVGKFCLPPLIDHRTSAWLRILLIDTKGFHARSGSNPTAEWAFLRRRATITEIA